MSPTISPLTTSISDLSAAIQQRQITCVELMKACLAQINAHDQTGLTLNAFLQVRASALDDARAMDDELENKGIRGPLHGIPFAVKGDTAVRGFPLTGGNLALGNNPVTIEAPVVTSLKQAGAICLGITNLEDLAGFASSVDSWSSRGGTTKCPFNQNFSAIGSSQGSCVAVASGMAPFAIGSQVLGSIVLPASRQGLVYLKPTAGKLSHENCMPGIKGMSSLGFLAKCVKDLELVWSAFESVKETRNNKAGTQVRKLHIGVPWDLWSDHHLQWNDLPSGWISKYKQAFAKFIGDLSTHTKHEVLDCTISKDKTAQEESGVENAVAGFVTSLLADQWEKYLGKRDKERGDCPKSCAELAM